MGKLEDALNLLSTDIDDAKRQWTDGIPMRSLPQRMDKSYEELFDTFDPTEDDDKWCSEYNSEEKRGSYLILYRKRMALLRAAQKELAEEYDPNVTDCDFMRLLEVPYTDSKYPIDYSLSEMKEP